MWAIGQRRNFGREGGKKERESKRRKGSRGGEVPGERGEGKVLKTKERRREKSWVSTGRCVARLRLHLPMFLFDVHPQVRNGELVLFK